MDAVEVDDVGASVASEWFLKAFGSGEATKRRYYLLRTTPCLTTLISMLNKSEKHMNK